jgi:predicted RNase H-like HicB family nuclease
MAVRMKFEVIVEKTERGKFVAAAVDYPGVSATGRTEKEALALVTKALELHLKRGRKPESS